MGLFDKVARILHENTEDTKNVAASTTPAKKSEPTSPPLDSEARKTYEQGFDCYRNREYEEAARLYRISADLGFFRAQYALALLYMEGYGVEKDLDAAELWAQRAADQGYEAAAKLVKELQEKQSAAADALALGINFYEQENYEQAVRHFRTAANADHADAQACLAACYATGEGVERDLDTAELWAKRALDSGDEQAAELLDAIHEEQRDEAFELGVSCYKQGDYTQAFQYYRAAAEQGNAKAQLALAFCYFEGEGVEQDLDAAILWAERASEQGFEAAAKLLKLLKTAKEHPFDLGVACLKQEDFEQAVLFFRIAAEQGDAKAQVTLAACYANGDGVERDLTAAAAWAQKAADQGLEVATETLEFIKRKMVDEAFAAGTACYEKGDYAQAVQHFRTAAESGDATAQFNLAVFYEQGEGVEQDQAEAVHWYLKAADQGNAKAQYNLAICYGRGEGVEKNLDTAITWAERAHEQGLEDAEEFLFALKLKREAAKPHFLIAAERGDANAQFDLALRYADGDGVEQDQSKAVHWYQKAAEQGHAKAQFNLAVRYENGNGVERDQTKAVCWYLKAAQQGHSGAQFNLALCYKDGDGVQEDQWKASHWFHMAAEQGYAVAQFNLAVRYEEGRGIHQDQSKAIRWYRTAAHHGYANAQNNLAICYEQGRGVKQDQREAVHWYRAAAEQGYASAQFNLALCYINGDGVEPNMPEAIHWYIKAAEQGHTTAQFNLAVRYENGNGVEKNQSEAVRWYCAAAEQGYANAQYNLSICYRDGDGVAVDLDTAELWAQKAVEQGHESAPKLLEGIRQRKNSR